jgi:hypothetical protein
MQRSLTQTMYITNSVIGEVDTNNEPTLHIDRQRRFREPFSQSC